MRASPTQAFHPRFIATMAVGLGFLSATAVGCMPGPTSQDDAPRTETRTIEVIATDGDTVVVIDGERHDGEVRMDEASGMFILMDGDEEVRRLAIPGGARVGDRDGAASRRTMLGIAMADVEDGVQVAGVMPDTAAARVGLREGDVIVAIGGTRGDMGRVNTSTLAKTISERSPGERVRLKVRREGEILTLAPKLGVGDPNDASRDGDRDRGESASMENFAREMEVVIREMIGDRFGDDEDEISMEFEYDVEFDHDDDRREGEDHRGHRDDMFEEMLHHVEGMMEEAHHEFAGWMEDIAERSGHWAAEAEHRLHEFAEMSDHRMHELAEMTDARMNGFSEEVERQLGRIMERQDDGRREIEMMFRERDVRFKERGMELQRSLGESGRKLTETLKQFAEHHKRLAEENRRLNERVERLEQAVRRMMSGDGPGRDRDDDDRMRGDDAEDQRGRSAERRRSRDGDSEDPDRPRRRGGDRD